VPHKWQYGRPSHKAVGCTTLSSQSMSPIATPHCWSCSNNMGSSLGFLPMCIIYVYIPKMNLVIVRITMELQIDTRLLNCTSDLWILLYYLLGTAEGVYVSGRWPCYAQRMNFIIPPTSIAADVCLFRFGGRPQFKCSKFSPHSPHSK